MYFPVGLIHDGLKYTRSSGRRERERRNRKPQLSGWDGN